VDSKAQDRYGATITYNIPLKGRRSTQALDAEIDGGKMRNDEQRIHDYILPLED
jgi:hypothetical protein